MSETQQSVDFLPVQDAIYGVALALDSFLLNGILIGVIQQTMAPGFLDHVAGHLLTPLADLEQHVPAAPVASQPRAEKVMAALRAKCQQLIDVVSGLRAFNALPVEEVQARVSQVPLVRGECIRLIQELERLFQTPRPFYQTRPAHATTSMDAFLANLPRLFEAERAAPVEDH